MVFKRKKSLEKKMCTYVSSEFVEILPRLFLLSGGWLKCTGSNGDNLAFTSSLVALKEQPTIYDILQQKKHWYWRCPKIFSRFSGDLYLILVIVTTLRPFLFDSGRSYQSTSFIFRLFSRVCDLSQEFMAIFTRLYAVLTQFWLFFVKILLMFRLFFLILTILKNVWLLAVPTQLWSVLLNSNFSYSSLTVFTSLWWFLFNFDRS